MSSCGYKILSNVQACLWRSTLYIWFSALLHMTDVYEFQLETFILMYSLIQLALRFVLNNAYKIRSSDCLFQILKIVYWIINIKWISFDEQIRMSLSTM